MDTAATNTAPVRFKKRPKRQPSTIKKRLRSDSDSDDSDDSRARPAKQKRQHPLHASESRRHSSEDPSSTSIRADRDAPLQASVDATKIDHESEARVTKGPKRAPTNVRLTTTIDFRPDTCKDYKKTGWCGYGDACIYAHDRSDTQQGWQLDLEWEKSKQNGNIEKGRVVASADRNRSLQTEEDKDRPAEGSPQIPFACYICEQPYRCPVRTLCGHYFCESCALGRYRKTPTCAACGSRTNGVFNAAQGLLKTLKRREGVASAT